MMPPLCLLACMSLALLSAIPAAAQELPEADVSVRKGVQDADPFVGEEATFFIAVTSEGPDTVSGVVIDDVLPEGLVYAAAYATRGNYDPGTGAWTVDTLAAGQTEVLELTTVVATERPIRNCASVRSSARRDATTANDTDCAYVRPKREKMVPLALHTTHPTTLLR